LTPAELLIGLLIALRGYPRGDLRSAGEVEFGEDVLYVVLRGAFGDEKPMRALAVGVPFGDEPGDLVLARAEDVGS
jgi:hypothetical protein